MQSLTHRLLAQIQRDGPISVSAYMTLCLHDPIAGYYATRPGIGEDFITAPEISQVFGELIGLWLAYEWQALGAPKAFYLVEAGPGRATLMQDALRAAASVPGCILAARLHLIEVSPALKAIQAEKLSAYDPVFISDLSQIPTDAPVLLVANEWLDCLPVNQFVCTGTAWHERMIGAGPNDTLAFGLSPEPVKGTFEHLGESLAREVQPGLATVAETLAVLFQKTPGRALMLDYGPADAPPQDSLRAYQAGQQIDPLIAPGQCDLTVDVDFQRLKHLGQSAGLRVDGPLAQGFFLQALGAEARLNQLARQAPGQATRLYQGVKKLVDPDQMGARFKALCLSSDGLRKPAGF